VASVFVAHGGAVGGVVACASVGLKRKKGESMREEGVFLENLGEIEVEEERKRWDLSEREMRMNKMRDAVCRRVHAREGGRKSS